MLSRSSRRPLLSHSNGRSFRRILDVAHWYRSATAGHRILPDYVIIGAQKAGTTSLDGYLARHPQVNVSTIKEVHYFDNRNGNFHRGEHWYRAHFPLDREANRGKRCGEATPNYLFSPVTPARMAALLPQVKIIVLLRNPVDRAFSHYQMMRRNRHEPLSFEAAIDAESSRLAGHRERLIADSRYDSMEYRRFSYLARGVYVDQITEWRKYFKPEQFLILESGEFFRETQRMFQRTLEFLQLDAWWPPKFDNLHRGNYVDKMSPATRERLLDYFAPHNARLYRELGIEYDWDRRAA